MSPEPVFVVTRPTPDHRVLMDTLGDKAIHNPAFELLPETDSGVASIIVRISDFDLAIVTSPFAARLLADAPVKPGTGRVRFIAPGRGTASLLGAAGRAAGFPVSGGTSEDILGMPEFRHVEGKRIAIVGAPGGRGLLARELSRRGAQVESLHIYRRKALPASTRLIRALARGERLVVFISSMQAFGMIQRSLPERLRPGWRGGHFVVSSERLETACRNAGVRRIQRASGAADEQMLAASASAGWLPPPSA